MAGQVRRLVATYFFRSLLGLVRIVFPFQVSAPMNVNITPSVWSNAPAFPSARSVFELWMPSVGHRENAAYGELRQ
jgi:hypothetical protein